MKYSLLGIGVLTAILVINQDTSGVTAPEIEKPDADQLRMMEELPFEQASTRWTITSPMKRDATATCQFSADFSDLTSVQLPASCAELIIGKADLLTLERAESGDIRIRSQNGNMLTAFYEAEFAGYESHGTELQPLVLEPAAENGATIAAVKPF